jgi:hypothetical protein
MARRRMARRRMARGARKGACRSTQPLAPGNGCRCSAPRASASSPAVTGWRLLCRYLFVRPRNPEEAKGVAQQRRHPVKYNPPPLPPPHFFFVKALIYLQCLVLVPGVGAGPNWETGPIPIYRKSGQ